MKRRLAVIGVLCVMTALDRGMSARQTTYRTLDNRFATPRYFALREWQARAVSRPRIAVLDVDAFDTSSDEDYLRRLFIPGLRRAGGLEMAAGFLPAGSVVHNAGARFAIDGVKSLARQLTAREISEQAARAMPK